MVTLSIIQADTGGWVGHSAVHPDQVREAQKRLEPHRLPLEDLEYTSMHDSDPRLADRWTPLPEPCVRASVSE